MIEAELALIAQIRDALQIRQIQLFRIAVNLFSVQPLKQVIEGRTEIVATAATIADVENPFEFTFEIRPVPEFLAFRIKAHDESAGWGWHTPAPTCGG